MEEGVAAALCTVTLPDCAELLPQALFAVAKIVPPDVDEVVEIEFVALVPDHPVGKVHV